MVCLKCIDTVGEILHDVKIDVTSILLGEVVIPHELNTNEKQALLQRLAERGFDNGGLHALRPIIMSKL
jgi:hypothetical protein